MGQTLPKYAQDEEGITESGGFAQWKEELIKHREAIDLEGQTDIRSSLIDVGKHLDDMIKSKEGKRKGAVASERIKMKNNFFVVKERDVVDIKGAGKVVNTVLLLVCKDAGLQGVMYQYDVWQCDVEEEVGFLGRITRYPVYAVESLAMRLMQIRASTYGTPNMKALQDYLEEEYPNLVKKAEDQLKDGKISYDCLWYVFERGNRFFTTIRKNQVIGSEVVHARYTSGMFEPHFQVSGEVIKSDGTKFYPEEKHFEISHFDGLVELDELSVKPMTRTVLAQLSARGKIFEKIALGHHFLNYERYIFYQHSAFRVHYTKADGRVMVDIATFNRMNPQYTEFGASAHVDPVQQQNFNIRTQLYNQGNPYYYQQQQQRQMQMQQAQAGFINQQMSLSEETLYKTWPTVAGFSFSAKAWGEIVISQLSEIKFDDNAYENLVLPLEKKGLIHALVQDNKVAATESKVNFTDIISGKGGGVIFLLHGPPGVGKTLTAEAIAELLHRPLYSVSVGELGTTSEQLEHKLQEILELASIWDAVVLVDEADIFLEKRTKHDIMRNAMVGIFLRKLEYHQGVLFLTTNRVKCFDPAFNSRVSVAIKYSDLDELSRAQVWKNLLAAARDKNLESRCEELGKYQLNGRQIRTTIRLALALARSEKGEMTREHIDSCINISHQFEVELEGEEEKDFKEEAQKNLLRLSREKGVDN